MSVESANGEGVDNIPLFDGEIEVKDKVSEKITDFAMQVIHLNSYLRQSLELNFAPLHSGEYGQTSSLIQEVVGRIVRFVICFPSWMGTLPFVSVAAAITAVGNFFHNSPYRTTHGTFSGEINKSPKLCLLNPRMLTGISPQRNAGISVRSDRFDCLVSTIRDNNPDVVFFPEVNRFNAPSLAASLKEGYHFFFTGMGEKILGEDTSFFIAFRGALLKSPEYVPFRKQDWLMERGYFIMETEERIYVCTYKPTREDWNEIFSREFGDKKQVVLMGEMESEDGEILLQKGFVSGISKDAQTTTSVPYMHYHSVEEGESTSIPLLYFSKMEGKTDVISMHGPENVAEALSDHALILHR